MYEEIQKRTVKSEPDQQNCLVSLETKEKQQKFIVLAGKLWDDILDSNY